MGQIILKPYSAFPSTPMIGGDVISHKAALEAMNETQKIMARQTAKVEDSFLRVGEMEDLELVSRSGTVLEKFVEEGWDDIVADISAGAVAGANVPSWTVFRNGIYAYEFSATLLKEVWINFHVRHDYKRGTTVFPHIHFAPNNTGTGVVRWGFEYTVARGHDQEPFPATNTVYVEYNIPSARQYQHIVAEVTENDSFDAFEPDTLILMRIFRDAAHANDTFTGTVHAFTADIHFQGDTQFTPYRSPDFYNP